MNKFYKLTKIFDKNFLKNDLFCFYNRFDGFPISGIALHNLLDGSGEFINWFRYREKRYSFRPFKDFISNSYNCALTFDTAKSLALVERTEAGREIYRFLIDKENELRKLKEKKTLWN